MTQHIIVSEAVLKLRRYSMEVSKYDLEQCVSLNDLLALIANSPQADGMVLDEYKEVLFGNFGALDFAIEHQESMGNNSVAEGLKALHYALTMLSAYKPQADDVRKDAERLDWIEKKFCGLSDSERYLPFRLSWGKGNNKTLREAIDKARE